MAQLVRQMSDSLYDFAADLKLAIAREADGENGDPNHLKGQEDLEASNQVMLAPGRGKGEALRLAIESYRERILKMIPDTAKQRNIASDLTTEVPAEKRSLGKNWQETQFEAMPAIAAVTIPCRNCRAMCAMPRRRCSTRWCRIST